MAAGVFFAATRLHDQPGGRGGSLGLRQAGALLAALAQRDADPQDAAERFDAWCAANIRPWYEDHVYWDATLLRRLAGEDIETEARIPSDVICAAAEADPAMWPVVGPFMSMEAPPAVLDRVADRARAVLRSGWRPRLRGRSEQGRTRGSARRARVRRELGRLGRRRRRPRLSRRHDPFGIMLCLMPHEVRTKRAAGPRPLSSPQEGTPLKDRDLGRAWSGCQPAPPAAGKTNGAAGSSVTSMAPPSWPRALNDASRHPIGVRAHTVCAKCGVRRCQRPRGREWQSQAVSIAWAPTSAWWLT